MLENGNLCQYQLWNFQGGRGTKSKNVFDWKSTVVKTRSLNFENWCNGEVSKSAKNWLSKSIFYVKNHPSLSDVVLSLKNMNLGAQFLLWHFLITLYLNFKAGLALPKMARSAQTDKSISFIWIVWSTLYVYLCFYLENFTTGIAIRLSMFFTMLGGFFFVFYKS